MTAARAWRHGGTRTGAAEPPTPRDLSLASDPDASPGQAAQPHARALLASSPEGTTDYLDADLRDTGAIIERAAATLDFSRPVAVILIGVLHLIGNEDGPHAIVRQLMAAVPPGSWLAILHPASDVSSELGAMTKGYNKRSATPATLRSQAEVSAFFDGLNLLPPGLVQLGCWVAGSPEPAPEPGMPAWTGLASKP